MKRFLKFILVCATVLLSPVSARADINYTFIKMTCDPSSKSVTIKAFYDWNEAGKARAERHEKDTYYLTDLSESHQKVVCNIDKGQTVSFNAVEGDAPKKDNLTIFINNKNFTSYLLGYGEWTATIQEITNNEYTVKDCPPNLPSMQGAMQGQEGKCTLSHVINGVWSKDYEIVDP